MLILGEIFKTQSDQKHTPKRTKPHHIFIIFSRELYIENTFEPHSICVQL